MLNESITVACVPPIMWNKDKTNYYQIRLTFHRETKYFKTNVPARQDEMTSAGIPKSPVMRRKLEDIRRQTEDMLAELDMFQFPRMTMRDVVDYLKKANTGAFHLDFFEFAREHIKTKGRSSANNYTCAILSLQEYMGCDKMDISQITSTRLRNWELWLRNKYGDGARSVSAYPAGIRYLHNQARLRYNDEERGYIPIKNPFQFYRPPQQRAARHRAVDVEIIRKMIAERKFISGRERLGVDCFLISFGLMGMNCPDIYSLFPSENRVFAYNRTKTRLRRQDEALMKVKLEPQVEKIAKDYLDGDKTHAFNFFRKYTTYQILGENINAGLKQFAKRIGYEGRLTMYSARHTFATTAYRLGVDKGVINDCLCHVDKDMKVTDIYIDKCWDVMWAANKKVVDFVFGEI